MQRGLWHVTRGMSALSGDETGVAVAPGMRPPLAVPRRLLRMRSDAALAERFSAGDEAAFDVIYERHRPVVLAVCMGVLGTPPDAEDATQETFSALAVALRTRPPAELRPWLIRVARNASIDTTRRRRHRLLTLDGEIPDVPARPTSPGRAELAVVLDGIRELPEGQRMALLMRELGGHSYAEIAAFLATDEEAVKGLIARARVGLRTYREATELSCASARGTIAAEPDGRRYDKTIRRHLRGCPSCRAYRDALRDDARALRAALPIQAGTVATGSLTSGLLSAAKGSLLGYGLTQAATTCAASACAVGAIGGMVLVAPVHKLGLPPILPAAKLAPTPTPKHTPAPRLRHHRAIVLKHMSTKPVTTWSPTSETATPTAPPVPYKPAVTDKPAVTATAEHPTHTRAGSPLPTHGDGKPALDGRGDQTGLGDGAGRGSGASSATGNGHGYGSWKNATSAAAPQPATQTRAAAPQPATQTPAPSTPAPAVGPSSQGMLSGNGNGHGHGHGHGGNPHYAIAAPAPATTVPPTAPTTTTTPTTTPSTTGSWSNDGNGHGNGHAYGHDK